MRAALLNTLHYELISHFITLYDLLDTVGVVLFVRYSMACDGLSNIYDIWGCYQCYVYTPGQCTTRRRAWCVFTRSPCIPLLQGEMSACSMMYRSIANFGSPGKCTTD